MIMSQVHKDPTIRLFGRTIQLAPNDDVSGEQSSDHKLCYSTGSVSVQSLSDKNHADTTSSSALDYQSKSSTIISSSSSPHEEQGGSSESQDDDNNNNSNNNNNNNKPLKKPTKILPCPRCNSSDTKFCYFNNYNMNQPRHFCKVCQRYWTAGGSMRNMAIGAGRRKTKNISSSPSLHQEMNPPDSQNPATINFQDFAPIWPNPAAFFPLPVYASTPYWTWVNPDCANSALGKHPRDTNKVNQGAARAEESTVLVPRTLRFDDDPTEAAMSSIWTTLGIKNRKKSSRCGDFFGGFESRGEETNTEKSTTRVLQANPAALSRSLTFHEIVE